jgi:hypothetical protein
METVLRRGLRPGHAPIPDLIIVDGSSGQQAAALRTLNAFAVPVPTLGISERPVLNAGTRNLASGHADAAGPAAYNQALSERRAAVVSRALIDAGVNPTTVLVAAYGESRLLHPTADGVADPRNRRVEVVFQRAATPAIVSRGGPCPYGTVNGTTVTYTLEEFVAYRTCMEALHGDWMRSDAGGDSDHRG